MLDKYKIKKLLDANQADSSSLLDALLSKTRDSGFDANKFENILDDTYDYQVDSSATYYPPMTANATTRKNGTSPLAVFVPQAFGAILDATKFGYGKLGTYGAGPCCIVAAYCAAANRIFMAHIDGHKYISDCCIKINYWLRDDESQQVDIHLLSGVGGRWDYLLTEVSKIPNSKIIQCELNDLSRSSKQLLLDTNGAYTSKFAINEVSTISKLKQDTYNTYAMFMANDNYNSQAPLILINDEKNHTENKRPPGCTLDKTNSESILPADSKKIDLLLHLHKQKTEVPTPYLSDNTPIDPQKNPFQIVKASKLRLLTY